MVGAGVAPAPTNDVPMRLSRCWWPRWLPGAGRPGRSRTLGRWFWRPRRRPGSSLCDANGWAAHDGVRGSGERSWEAGKRSSGYQLMPGPPLSCPGCGVSPQGDSLGHAGLPS